MKRLCWSLAGLMACAQPPPPAAPKPVAVKALTLAPGPVEDTSDYLATLTSKRSVTLHPQVSGTVRAIWVKSGDVVKAGAVLLTVDAAAESAALRNLEATQESLAATAAFAKERKARTEALRGDGIVSQQETDQARSQAEQAEAGLRAAQASVASQKARLGFYAITAPFDGVVGHLPVKVGDLVTPATPLTSVTQSGGLEAELLVPVERASSVGPESRVRLLDTKGAVLAESAVSFVAPKADLSTQLVLVKAPFEELPGLRADQLVKARVVFTTKEALSIPAGAVTRQAGQAFAFVVEDAHAKRKPVSLGVLQADRYVVSQGLDAGQRVVVTALQHVSDGAEVAATEAER